MDQNSAASLISEGLYAGSTEVFRVLANTSEDSTPTASTAVAHIVEPRIPILAAKPHPASAATPGNFALPLGLPWQAAQFSQAAFHSSGK